MKSPPAINVIDREAQNLPVPLGGMAPVRVRRRRPRRALASRLPWLCLMAGMACGLTGLGLLLVPLPVAVALYGDHLEVGSMILRADPPGTGGRVRSYHGDASYVLDEGGNGDARAAAAWVAGGTVWSGSCSLRADGSRLLEDCAFTVDAGTLTSVDVLDPSSGSVWQRTYSDGVRATIAVSPDGAAVPVPFPIGR